MREKFCSVDGCRKTVHSKGLCRRHYTQQWVRKNPDKMRAYSLRKYKQSDIAAGISRIDCEISILHDALQTILPAPARVRTRRQIARLNEDRETLVGYLREDMARETQACQVKN